MTTLVKLRQWFIILVVSFIITGILCYYHVPAFLLLGPMISGIIFGLRGFTVSLPKLGFTGAQAILGCLVASGLSASIIHDIFAYWHTAIFIVFSTLVISVFLGKFLTRFSTLPGSTAMWGILPGGASMMVVICSDFGGDARLVALIQYLRVMSVVLVMAIISPLYSRSGLTTGVQELIWFPPLTAQFGLTLLLALAGACLARVIHIPSGRVLFPMLIAAICQVNGLVQIDVPEWLLALSFGMIGLSVGLKFNAAILRQAIKALPMIFLTILLMILFCLGQAVLLHLVMDYDFLSCFLATSPGGIESSVIIALDTHSNLSLVVPLQILRLFSVLLFGPLIIRFFTRKQSAKQAVKQGEINGV